MIEEMPRFNPELHAYFRELRKHQLDFETAMLETIFEVKLLDKTDWDKNPNYEYITGDKR